MLGPVLPRFVHVAFVGLWHVAYWEIVVAVLVKDDTTIPIAPMCWPHPARCPTPELSSRSRLMTTACPVSCFFAFVIGDNSIFAILRFSVLSFGATDARAVLRAIEIGQCRHSRRTILCSAIAPAPYPALHPAFSVRRGRRPARSAMMHYPPAA